MSDHFALHRRAQDCIAQAALTNSKRPSCHVQGVYPTHVARGHGGHLWDHAGRKYLDFICGLGTNILGYGDARVNAAIAAQLPHGASLSFSTHHELETAEKVKELVPFVDAVKFLKSGSEACSAAIRIARAATGRHYVLSDAYHGWHDEFVSLTPPAYGVPNDDDGFTRAIEPFHKLDQIDSTVAAVIVEPVVTDASDARRAYLQELRKVCTKHGTLLIFDEVITGFRWPRFTVATNWSITPDLICLGKAIANGMPLAVVGGKYAVMNCPDEYFVSSTYAGETLSLVAAKTTMTLLQTKYDLANLWEHGAQFLDGFNAIWPEAVRIEGYPSRGAFKGDLRARAMFFQEACLAGLLFGPSFFLSFAHLGEMHGVLDTCRDILGRVKRGEVRMKGELPSSPFAERVRAKSA
jgi:glutamate-1-semialdehyde aminotransferase